MCIRDSRNYSQELTTAARRRLDAELLVRGMAPSRTTAQQLIAAGRVTVGGAPALKASRQVAKADAIVVLGEPNRFVGRGAHKLEEALDAFGIDVADKVALDVGASTGGFTDSLLQRGARLVAAVDVGTNQLHERLQASEQVLNLEQQDIRSFRPSTIDGLPSAFEVIGVDLSFISTTSILSTLASLLADSGDLVILMKPQFEAGRAEVSRGKGIIREPSIWVRVLHELIDAAPNAGVVVVDLALSPITGGKGNVEFLAHLQKAGATRHTGPVQPVEFPRT